jgi:hypothetical protein
MKRETMVIVFFFIIVALVMTYNCQTWENFNNLGFVKETELKKLLRIARDNFAEAGIKYGIYNKTLKSAMEYKDIGPYDNTAELFIFDSDIDKIERIDWGNSIKLYKNQYDYKLFFIDARPAIINNQKMPWNFPFVNIHVLKKNGSMYTTKDGSFLSEDEIFPLKQYQYGDLLLMGPNTINY